MPRIPGALVIVLVLSIRVLPRTSENALMLPMAASAIRPTINPYSTAVAPQESAINRLAIRMSWSVPLVVMTGCLACNVTCFLLFS